MIILLRISVEIKFETFQTLSASKKFENLKILKIIEKFRIFRNLFPHSYFQIKRKLPYIVAHLNGSRFSKLKVRTDRNEDF